MGCAHKTIIRTEPEGALVEVDGQILGPSPVIIERSSGTGGKMQIQASADGFQNTALDVERTDWFFWPALLALTPAVGLPLVLIVPPAGPLIALGWACFTCPTSLSLLFIQKYPDEVVVELPPRIFPGEQDFLPTDDWTTPEEYQPNPLPFLPSAKPDLSPKEEQSRQPLPDTPSTSTKKTPPNTHALAMQH